MARRESKWTSIYYEGSKPYVRFTPTFLPLETLGFNHGIPLGSGLRESKEDAVRAADMYDAFFDAMYERIKANVIKELAGKK